MGWPLHPCILSGCHHPGLRWGGARYTFPTALGGSSTSRAQAQEQLASCPRPLVVGVRGFHNSPIRGLHILHPGGWKGAFDDTLSCHSECLSQPAASRQGTLPLPEACTWGIQLHSHCWCPAASLSSEPPQLLNHHSILASSAVPFLWFLRHHLLGHPSGHCCTAAAAAAIKARPEVALQCPNLAIQGAPHLSYLLLIKAPAL
eukprot:gene8993-biopygen201